MYQICLEPNFIIYIYIYISSAWMRKHLLQLAFQMVVHKWHVSFQIILSLSVMDAIQLFLMNVYTIKVPPFSQQVQREVHSLREMREMGALRLKPVVAFLIVFFVSFLFYRSSIPTGVTGNKRLLNFQYVRIFSS